MDPYGRGTGDHPHNNKPPSNNSSSNTNSLSFVNPLASMISMMQQQQQHQQQGQSSPGIPGIPDEHRGLQSSNTPTTKAPAKITMNIPSFFPKIHAPQSSQSSVPHNKKPSEEIDKPQSQQPQNVKHSFVPINVNVKEVSSPSQSLSISTQGPPRLSSPVFSSQTASANVSGSSSSTTSNNVSNPRSSSTSSTSGNVPRSTTVLQKQHSPNPTTIIPVRHHRPGPASSRNLLSSTNSIRPQQQQQQQQVYRSATGAGNQNPLAAAVSAGTSLRTPTPTTTLTNKVSLSQQQHLLQPVHKKSNSKPQPLQVDPLSISGDPLATEVEEILEDPLNLQKCDVPGCSHVKSSVISLFSIPQHGITSWCQTLKIDISHLDRGEIASLRICSEHFDLSQFVEGSACKELKATAVPRPSVFSVSALTMKETASSEPALLKFVPLPVPIPPVEKPLSFPDVTIHKIHAPLESPVQQPQLSQMIHPGTPVATAVSSPLSYTPPSKVQIMTTPVPSQPEKDITKNIIPKDNSQLEKSSLSSSDITKSVVSMAAVAQQVGIRKPGPGNASRGPRGRPRKNPVTANVPYTPNISTARPQLRADSPAVAVTASLVAATKLPQVEQVNPLHAKVAVGSYCRPTIKAKSENVKVDELADLVMPSEDWSVNVYPSFNKDSKNQICTISETILNSDMVEIVKKSITVHSTWAMKFSLFSRDMSHFNLGLGVTEMSDLQAVLDNFHALPCCKGLTDILNNKNVNLLSLQMKVLVERFVDNVFRSVNCPLLIVNPEPRKIEVSKFDGSCSHCHNLSQNLAFLKLQ